ncbi:uncharacterized protein LOC143892704 [Tasmannia lanceolata]|uniref:uncharacterized protein LOC143892704 n=1 Tax=Tasmannia lanceolata TaxID=3420 RepID=UPI004063774A
MATGDVAEQRALLFEDTWTPYYWYDLSICLRESKAFENVMDDYISEISDNWNAHANYAHTEKGRIWVLWNPHLVHVAIIIENDQFIHGEATALHSNNQFEFTVVYASNNAVERRILWDNMNNLATGIHRPWIALGDFNVIRFSDERWGGRDPIQADIQDFNCCIDTLSLTDVRSIWHFLTWNNNSRMGNLKLRRLDRALVNEDRFHNMWLMDTSLYEIVERAWNIQFDGNPMFRATKKLKEVKKSIKEWNDKTFGRIDTKIPMLKQNLEGIQSRLQAHPFSYVLRKEESPAKEDLCRISRQEEALFHQKSKINWLNLGDSNTAFFHSAMNMRRNQNSIQAIARTDGEITTNPDEIEDILVSYFHSTLNHNQSFEGDTQDPSKTLSIEEANSLILPFSNEEIREVVFKADGNKAPGPDCFNGSFFKSFWWVSQCISTASFSILINGIPKGFFNSTNGLRQGDPLSPLLFCITMEMLTTFLNQALLHKHISSPFSKGDLTITHLLFAYDVMIFIDPSTESALGVKNCLAQFRNWSGLDINTLKSKIFFTGCSDHVKEHVYAILNISEGVLPIKYLGLPLVTTRLSANDCQPLLSKIRNMIVLWSNRNLARAGRLELIKSVLGSF